MRSSVFWSIQVAQVVLLAAVLVLNRSLVTTRLPIDPAELKRIEPLFDWSTLVWIYSTRHSWLVVVVLFLFQMLQVRAWRAGNIAVWFEIACWSVVNAMFCLWLLAAGLTAMVSLYHPH